MKKLLSVILAIAICAMLACPVFAAEFVPSITYKGAPDLVGFDGGYVGIIKDGAGTELDKVDSHCLLITSVADAPTSTKIPEDAKKLLLEVYDKLVDGSMELPYDKVGKDPSKMVIRDLVDISWLCEDHPAMLAVPGNTLTVKIDLGVAAGVDVTVMTYVGGEWVPAVSVVNNGDGTITLTVEDICPVAFSVGADSEPPKTGDEANVGLWVAMMGASLVALVGVVLVYRRSMKKA